MGGVATLRVSLLVKATRLTRMLLVKNLLASDAWSAPDSRA